MLQEGFTEVSFGEGPWIQLPREYLSEAGLMRMRMDKLIVFYHPSGRIAVFARESSENWKGQRSEEGKFQKEYLNEAEFHCYLEAYKIKLVKDDEQKNLAEIVKKL